MKTLCLKRINKDLKEIANSPLEGIGIASIDNDPMKYVVNLKIMTGVYEGYCIQLLLTFSDNYPIRPPKLLIYPGQSFDNIYHHHIFRSEIKDEKERYFNKFCYDLLENDFLSTSSEEHTGWNPSYTISTLLLQIQTFLSKPDFPTGYVPPKEKIDELMKSMNTYEKSFVIKNDKNENITKIHTWKNPYPEMFFIKKEDSIEIKEGNDSAIPKEIKEDLTCFISRLNYIDDKNILLGYPMKRIKNGTIIPIPEILSYEGFIEELSKNDVNNEMDSYFDGLIFENIYRDYHRNYILNRISEYLHINDNDNDNDNNNGFNEINNLLNIDEDILMFPRRHFFHFFSSSYSRNYGYFKSANNEFYNSWLPIFINEEHFEKNKTTILNYFSILKYGNSGIKKYDFHPQYIFEIMPNILSNMIKKMTINKISSSFLKCFFQNVLMFKKLEKKYNNIFIKYQKFYLNRNINKILKQDEIFDLVKELLELLILFYYSDNKDGQNMNDQLNNYIKKLKNLLCLKLFEKEKFYFKNPKSFINDLKRNKLFDKIVDIIFLNSDYLLLYNKQSLLNISEIIRNRIIKQMNINFKDLYTNLNDQIKKKIQKILMNEVNFSSYLNLNSIPSLLKEKGIYADFFSYSSKFISIFDFFRQKILDKNFLNELEKNFGIFMNNEPFIEQLNQRKKNWENSESIIKTFLGDKNLNSIKNLIHLYYLNLILGKYSSNYTRHPGEFVDFPFMKIDNHDNCLYLTLSERVKYILKKERDLFCLKYKMMFYKKEIVKDKIMKKNKRERINIKRSCNKNYNKAIRTYNTKKHR